MARKLQPEIDLNSRSNPGIISTRQPERSSRITNQHISRNLELSNQLADHAQAQGLPLVHHFRNATTATDRILKIFACQASLFQDKFNGSNWIGSGDGEMLCLIIVHQIRKDLQAISLRAFCRSIQAAINVLKGQVVVSFAANRFDGFYGVSQMLVASILSYSERVPMLSQIAANYPLPSPHWLPSFPNLPNR